jgi:GrpB-like predicted nucleotidyltransferase (UPF0157 family)
MKDLRKYSFRKYSSSFVTLFRKEKQILKKLFPKAQIEHIGSSSVKGLGGKGIIDISIAVSKPELKKSIRQLQKIGFEYRPFAGDKDRKFFQKIVKYKKDERRVHIQLTYKGSYDWSAVIAVRNYLRKHKDAVKKYSQIKKDAAIRAKGEGKKYREIKKRFIDTLEKKALKEMQNK